MTTSKNSHKNPQKLPTSKLLKILIPSIILNFGNYYIFDIPQQLAFSFMNQFKKNPKEVANLYSLYAIPSIPIAFIGGFLVKKFNSSNSSLITTGVILVSSLITLLGVKYTNYFFVEIGRVLFGLTGEMSMVAQNTILAEWFGGKILSLATGLNQTVNNLGLTGSYFLTGFFYGKTKGNFMPFFAGFISCLVSFLANLAYVFYNKKYEGEGLKNDGEEVNEEEDTKIDWKIFKEFKFLFWVNVFITCLQSITYYGFTAFSAECMIKRFGYTLENSEKLIGLMPLISVPSVPIYSAFMQKKGYKTLIVCFGNFTGVLSFYILMNIKEKNSWVIYIPIFLLSQFLSIHGACSWTNLALSVRKRAISVGFGMTLFIMNILAAIFPYFVGKIIERDNWLGYQNALGVVFQVAFLNFLLSFVLVWKDLKEGGVLYYPENSERVKEILMRRELGKEDMSGVGYEEVGSGLKNGRNHMLEII